MGIFEAYARYYDLFYQDKDYPAETKFIHDLIQKYMPNAKSILDLGCGTGAHAHNLVREGYCVHGVDRSIQMLKYAQDKISKLPDELISRLSFSQGDMRHIRLNRVFDVVISLFHVISYQVTDAALQSAFATAMVHLKARGIFIFDCWYGPAVLTDRPAVRIRRVEDNAISITRTANPVMQPYKNVVNVHYTVSVNNRSLGTTEKFSELHQMRYLFKPEIETLLSKNGFQLLDAGEGLTSKPLSSYTWGGYFIARA